ncbi:MAG TPA: cytochrome b/b6 domain-containing protein [Ignavibacteria bacterium]
MEEKKYLRMTKNERIQHFLLLSTFITLVITGFALKYPETWWVKWIVAVIGKNAFEFRGVMHRIAAVMMIAASFYHLFYVIFTRRGRQLIKDLWFYKQDITDLFASLKYLVSDKAPKPNFGRFSYIEKAEYWAVVWGTVVMGATGALLWFENIFLPVIGMGGMNIATAIHWFEAILASLAILVWHFYFIFLNPDVAPMNRAWINGHLTREQMEHEHPRELAAIEESIKENDDKENIINESV